MSLVSSSSSLLLVGLVAIAGCLSPLSNDENDDGPGSARGGLVPGAPPTCDLDAWMFPCTTIASPNDSPSQTEIDIAVNPLDPLNVFAASKDLDPLASECVWSVGQVTKDGGRTWKAVYVGGTAEERTDPGHPLWGWECVTDPILAFDSHGILYYPLQIYMEDNTHENTCVEYTVPGAPHSSPCNSAYLLAVSHDGGETFPVEDILTMTYTTGAVTYHDYPRMIVNPVTGTVTTAWNAIPGGAYISSTRDQGQTVDPPTVIPGAGFDTGLAVASDGTVYLGLNGGILAVSTDDSKTFETTRMLPPQTGASCSPDNETGYRCGKGGPELSVDISGGPNDGRLYAVWTDGRNDASDILIAWSDNGGTSWSEAVKVNSDTTTSVQWMPRVDVGPDGAIHVVYLDRSYEMNPPDRFYDATYSWSTDGGETWSSKRVTPLSSDGNLGVHQSGAQFIGDYIGIDAVAGHVYMTYPVTYAEQRAEVAVTHVIFPGA